MIQQDRSAEKQSVFDRKFSASMNSKCCKLYIQSSADQPDALTAPSLPDCLSYTALQVLSRRCYGKQRCKVLVDNYHFGSPCLPGVKKYLTVAYACGKKNLSAGSVNTRLSGDGSHVQTAVCVTL